MPNEIEEDQEVSEFYVNTMEHVIGVGFHRCEATREAIKAGDKYPVEMVRACFSWWNSICGFQFMIQNLTVQRGELSHINHSIGNHKMIISKYINEHLGFNPFFDIGADGRAKNKRVPKTWTSLGYRQN